MNPVYSEFRVEYKCIVPGESVNIHNTAKGSYIFDLMDMGAFTRINPIFAGKGNGVLVTTDASIKYSSPVNPFEYIEVHVSIINITASKITTDVNLYSRKPNSLDWRLAATGEFSFSLIDKTTRKLLRVPREAINEVKG